MRSLLEDMESSAMTWMQGNDGQWRVMENMIGGLWALEDAAKRLVAAVRKSAMMQLILKTMGVGIKSEIETAVKIWRTQTQARRMRRWLQWRAWVLTGMEISRGIPSDNETARGTEQWKEMEENSRGNDYTARELMSIAVDKYNWLAGQEGIANRVEEAEMEITFRGQVRSLLEDMECSARTWMQA